MPDSRSHRGAHPQDAKDFAAAAGSRLAAAAGELSYLFEKRYSVDAALKLVGDHHQLTARQRKAVLRGACAKSSAELRRSRRKRLGELKHSRLRIDGFNCLITVEAMLSGAPLFLGRDGALRDLASVHGTYRSVQESERAVDLILAELARGGLSECEVLLDKPVGNSGRTRQLFEVRARALGVTLSVRLSDHVDRELAGGCDAVATSDSWILEHAPAWVDLPAEVAEHTLLELWLVDLSCQGLPG